MNIVQSVKIVGYSFPVSGGEEEKQPCLLEAWGELHRVVPIYGACAKPQKWQLHPRTQGLRFAAKVNFSCAVRAPESNTFVLYRARLNTLKNCDSRTV